MFWIKLRKHRPLLFTKVTFTPVMINSTSEPEGVDKLAFVSAFCLCAKLKTLFWKHVFPVAIMIAHSNFLKKMFSCGPYILSFHVVP